MKKGRAELHLHTNMSMMDGVSSLRDYVDMAVEEGISAIAITDHDSVQAITRKYDVNINLKDVKLIFGTEGYMTAGTKSNRVFFHTSLLVKNQTGLKNLYKLITLSKTEYHFRIPQMPKSEIDGHREGLLIGSGCEMGEIYTGIADKKSDEELMEAAKFYDYLEIVPVENFRYYIDCGYAKTVKELREINKRIVELGERLNKPVVAVSDAHYARKEDAIYLKILKHYQGFMNFDNAPDLSMKTTEEMLEEFSYLGEKKAYEIVVENTNLIADMIDEEISPYNTYMDSYPLCDKEKLLSLVNESLAEKYGENPHPEIINRLNWELSKILELDSSVFALCLSYEIVKHAKAEGWNMGNRGAIASSFVAYLLGIVDINPMDAHYYCPDCHYIEFHKNYNCGADMEDNICECGKKLLKDGFTIPPESFYGNGFSIVDVCYNLAPESIPKMHDYIKETFGLKLCRIGNIKKVAYTTACKMIDNYSKDTGVSFDEATTKDIIDKLTRVKMSVSASPGKVVALPDNKEIFDFTPLEYSSTNDLPVTHFDDYNNNIDSALCSFDILPHNDPAMIEKLEKLTGVKGSDIPLDDKKTFELFRNCDTNGIPEFSTDYIKKEILAVIWPEKFDDLIRISGLSHGTCTWKENGEDLIKEGKNVSEITACRDDVMIDLLRAGVERKEAFRISRRIRFGKGINDDYKTLSDIGIEKWKLDSWNKIKYLFPRAHSASYALYAYWMAYYKVHFPDEFYCAYLSVYAKKMNDSLNCITKEDIGRKIRLLSKKDLSSEKEEMLYCLTTLYEMLERGYEIRYRCKYKFTDLRFCVEDEKIIAVY